MACSFQPWSSQTHSATSHGHLLNSEHQQCSGVFALWKSENKLLNWALDLILMLLCSKSIGSQSVVSNQSQRTEWNPAPIRQKVVIGPSQTRMEGNLSEWEGYRIKWNMSLQIHLDRRQVINHSPGTWTLTLWQHSMKTRQSDYNSFCGKHEYLHQRWRQSIQ